jgi:hypothetical protein
MPLITDPREKVEPEYGVLERSDPKASAAGRGTQVELEAERHFQYK